MNLAASGYLKRLATDFLVLTPLGRRIFGFTFIEKWEEREVFSVAQEWG